MAPTVFGKKVVFLDLCWQNLHALEVCIFSYWLQLFKHKYRDGLACSLKMEAIFLVSPKAGTKLSDCREQEVSHNIMCLLWTIQNM